MKVRTCSVCNTEKKLTAYKGFSKVCTACHVTPVDNGPRTETTRMTDESTIKETPKKEVLIDLTYLTRALTDKDIGDSSDPYRSRITELVNYFKGTEKEIEEGKSCRTPLELRPEIEFLDEEMEMFRLLEEMGEYRRNKIGLLDKDGRRYMLET